MVESIEHLMEGEIPKSGLKSTIQEVLDISIPKKSGEKFNSYHRDGISADNCYKIGYDSVLGIRLMQVISPRTNANKTEVKQVNQYEPMQYSEASSSSGALSDYLEDVRTINQ